MWFISLGWNKLPHDGAYNMPELSLRDLEFNKQIGIIIRNRRMLLGITLERMAEHLEVNRAQAQKYENGTNRIPVGRLFSMCAILGCTIKEVMEEVSKSDILTPVPFNRQLSLLIESARDITDPKHLEALLELTRTFSEK